MYNRWSRGIDYQGLPMRLASVGRIIYILYQKFKMSFSFRERSTYKFIFYFSASCALHPKKSAAQKIFGSNLFLNFQKLHGTPQIQWAAIAAAHEKISEIGFSLT